MRWLVICLLVSLAGLLIAAGGIIYHIAMKHRELRRTPTEGLDAVEEPEIEPRI